MYTFLSALNNQCILHVGPNPIVLQVGYSALALITLIIFCFLSCYIGTKNKTVDYATVLYFWLMLWHKNAGKNLLKIKFLYWVHNITILNLIFSYSEYWSTQNPVHILDFKNTESFKRIEISSRCAIIFQNAFQRHLQLK